MGRDREKFCIMNIIWQEILQELYIWKASYFVTATNLFQSSLDNSLLSSPAILYVSAPK